MLCTALRARELFTEEFNQKVANTSAKSVVTSGGHRKMRCLGCKTADLLVRECNWSRCILMQGAGGIPEIKSSGFRAPNTDPGNKARRMGHAAGSACQHVETA